jgi:hypothetical protein
LQDGIGHAAIDGMFCNLVDMFPNVQQGADHPAGRPHVRMAPMMLKRYTEQRSSPRAFIIFPISINSPAAGKTHQGIVRDVSADGIFFYSTFRPRLQSDINFVLHVKGKKIAGTGKVVRVEQAAPGAAIGVAVKSPRLSGFEYSLDGTHQSGAPLSAGLHGLRSSTPGPQSPR